MKRKLFILFEGFVALLCIAICYIIIAKPDFYSIGFYKSGTAMFFSFGALMAISNIIRAMIDGGSKDA